ncbi:MAG TPA: adenylosuccinate synthase [Coleofasciculaceae cyanobacterium]|jgi:adenylosuccinate synthase
MANVVVVGAQWGDEGKAKITDLLAAEADVVVRCQGGCNAGHTVKHGDDVIKFHLVPSGLLYPDTLCIIGPGTVIHPEVLVHELESLQEKGYRTEGLRLSNRAHVTLPFHVDLDKAQESAMAEKKIGTTGRGIGPTYMDKVGRYGLRIGDLYDSEFNLRERLRQIVELKSPLLEKCYPQLPKYTVDELYSWCRHFAEKLEPYVADTVVLLHEAIAQGKSILFEGAQGTLLDVDYGTYPFVTSSNATAGGACTGSGIGPTQIDRVIGVMKAYTTRVGEGPFPTELRDETGKHLSEVGQEFGTTTGRARRCGWFDAIIAKYSVLVNGLDGLAVTKLDVFDGMPELRVCVAYRDKETGREFTHFPAQLSDLRNVEPVYETLPGWQGSVKGARSFEELPTEARHYLQRVTELIGCPVSIISIGPERNQTILVENPMTNGKRILQRLKPATV